MCTPTSYKLKVCLFGTYTSPAIAAQLSTQCITLCQLNSAKSDSNHLQI